MIILLLASLMSLLLALPLGRWVARILVRDQQRATNLGLMGGLVLAAVLVMPMTAGVDKLLTEVRINIPPEQAVFPVEKLRLPSSVKVCSWRCSPRHIFDLEFDISAGDFTTWIQSSGFKTEYRSDLKVYPIQAPAYQIPQAVEVDLSSDGHSLQVVFDPNRQRAYATFSGR